MNPSQAPMGQLSPSQQRTQQLMQQRHQQLQLQQQQQYQQQQQSLGDQSTAATGQTMGFQQNTGQGPSREGSSAAGGFLSRREGQQQQLHPQLQQQQPSFPQDFKFPGFGGGGGGGGGPNSFLPTDNNHRYLPSMLSPSSSQPAASMSLSSHSASGGGGSGFQQANTTGLESLESLASLSVLSPSLPVPTGSGGGNRGGGGGGPEVVDRKNSGGYFSPSFQPLPSMPATYQSHQQQQQQGSYGSPQHHHQAESSNTGDAHGASPYPSTSSFGMPPSSMSSSLPMPSNFHLYGQSHLLGSQQSQQQQQQHHPLSGYSLQDGSSSSSSNPLLASPQNNSNNASTLSSFSRETRPRSRSGSPANHSHSSMSPIRRNTRINSFSHHLRSNNSSNNSQQADALSTLSSSSSSSTATASTSATTWTGGGGGAGGTGNPYTLSPMTPPPVPTTRSSARGLSIPPQPRMVPPRAPETGTPRKYHGRQLRKVPIPTIDLVSGVRDYVVPPTRRLAHILSEQKRREKINAGFEELKSVIPECAQNTDSKATILRKAVDRILELEGELRKYTADYDHNNNNEEDDQVDRKQKFTDWEE
ncbi:MAG: hypothetical protein JOS17DRAFT_774768 [Linnemannia elongata]|nr:MAG: hypothetical protein JOS17DRAFT_774768 [Linnemannia elongata]